MSDEQAQGLPKAYDAASVEAGIYARWLTADVFAPDGAGSRADPSRPPFVIIQPPPNVTGVLHLGHAQRTAVEDAMTRHARMTGRPTLYLPGKDHSGIAAQYVLDRILAAEGESRQSLGRERYLERMRAFMAETRPFMTGQLRAGRRVARLEPRALHHGRRLGAGRAHGLQTPLRRRPGLSDRGARQLVPDLPDEHLRPGDDRHARDGHALDDPLPPRGRWRPPRPGGLDQRGDDAPGDDPGRHRRRRPPGGRALSASHRADRAHPLRRSRRADHRRRRGRARLRDRRRQDHACARPRRLRDGQAPRPGLRSPCSTTRRGSTRLVAGTRASTATKRGYGSWPTSRRWATSRAHVRTRWSWGAASAATTSSSPGSRRSGSSASRRWPPRRWPRCARGACASCPPASRRSSSTGSRTSATGTSAASSGGAIASRPGTARTATSRSPTCPKDRPPARPAGARAWTSSRIRTSSTPGSRAGCGPSRPWAGRSGRRTSSATTRARSWRRPTRSSSSGSARMMMLGEWLLGEPPFGTVWLGGIVRDPYGAKMSKTKGNVEDPLATIDEMGADALRFALVHGLAPGADVRMSRAKLEGARNFGNKLWNAARFVLGARPAEMPETASLTLPDAADLGPAERWILGRCAATIEAASRAHDAYQLGEVDAPACTRPSGASTATGTWSWPRPAWATRRPLRRPVRRPGGRWPGCSSGTCACCTPSCPSSPRRSGRDCRTSPATRTCSSSPIGPTAERERALSDAATGGRGRGAPRPRARDPERQGRGRHRGRHRARGGPRPARPSGSWRLRLAREPIGRLAPICGRSASTPGSTPCPRPGSAARRSSRRRGRRGCRAARATSDGSGHAWSESWPTSSGSSPRPSPDSPTEPSRPAPRPRSSMGHAVVATSSREQAATLSSRIADLPDDDAPR